jgi:putative flavoprotein involved in K+ transport
MRYDVLVIGAGQAGLAAGYYLQRAGYTFALLGCVLLAGTSSLLIANENHA